jgi:MFS family permease
MFWRFIDAEWRHIAQAHCYHIARSAVERARLKGPSSMPSPSATLPFGADRDLQRTLWLTLALFLSYLCVALSLPIISVFVTRQLGLDNGWAGLAVGITFASTVVTRGMAGRMADHRGSKRTMVRGLWIYAAAGLICMGASWPGLQPKAAYAVLIASRLLLGVGESLTVVGLMAWCFGIMGPQRSGRVFALVGMALYGAFAVGSPVGLALFDRVGFAGVMVASALVPLVGLVMALPVAAVPVHPGERPSFWRIIGRIWEPGVALALAGVGSATIGAFLPLLFLHQGWSYAPIGLGLFGGGYVLVRIVFGHLPDRAGSVPVALVSVTLEAVGQALLWIAPNPAVALVGACMTGLGCSLMFPAMGMEVVRRVPPQLRGTAAGGLAAFQDLAFGLTGPVTGLLADSFGYSVVFLIGGVAAALGFGLVTTIAREDRSLPA